MKRAAKGLSSDLYYFYTKWKKLQAYYVVISITCQYHLCSKRVGDAQNHKAVLLKAITGVWVSLMQYNGACLFFYIVHEV